jgi:hypothetical protein
MAMNNLALAPTNFDVFGHRLWAEYTADLIKYGIWVVQSLYEREDTILNLPYIKQVTNKTFHKEQLRADQFEIFFGLLYFRHIFETLGSKIIDNLFELADEKKDRSERSLHLVTHCRCEVLRLLCLLVFLLYKFLLGFQSHLFRQICQEYSDRDLASKDDVLDFNAYEEITS